MKTSIVVAVVSAATGLIIGCYVGWKTTLLVLDSALFRSKAKVTKE